MSEIGRNDVRADLEQISYGARQGGVRRGGLWYAWQVSRSVLALVIDVSYAFTGDMPGEPILESIKRWRNSCGAESWDAIAHIKRLIDKAHERQVPVIYTTGARRADLWDSGGWTAKNSRSRESPKTPSNRDGYQIVDEIAPSPKDIVIVKQKPSGFFATPMAAYLT